MLWSSFTTVVFFRHKTLRTAANKLVINLAFSNAIMHIKSWVIIVNGFYGGPILGDIGKIFEMTLPPKSLLPLSSYGVKLP